MNGSVMNRSVMNVVCLEWSLINGLFWTDAIYIHMQNKQHPW